MKITGEKLSQLECFSFGNKTDSGLKISKQKLTFLGWYGLHKLTPLVIGKALKKIKNLLIYEYSANARMTIKIF